MGSTKSLHTSTLRILLLLNNFNEVLGVSVHFHCEYLTRMPQRRIYKTLVHKTTEASSLQQWTLSGTLK